MKTTGCVTWHLLPSSVTWCDVTNHPHKTRSIGPSCSQRVTYVCLARQGCRVSIKSHKSSMRRNDCPGDKMKLNHIANQQWRDLRCKVDTLPCYIIMMEGIWIMKADIHDCLSACLCAHERAWMCDVIYICLIVYTHTHTQRNKLMFILYFPPKIMRSNDGHIYVHRVNAIEITSVCKVKYSGGDQKVNYVMTTSSIIWSEFYWL